MDTLKYIANECELNVKQRRMPIEIPNVGRDWLAGLFARLEFTVGVEVGVERGLYSEVLCRANPDLHLFSVDPWEHYSGYRDHVSQEKLDGFFESAKERLSPYNVTLVRKYSVDAAGDFAKRSLDFVYIDGNHEVSYVLADIAAWVPRVRKGGIIAGHDYRLVRSHAPYHVPYAVQAYTSAYRVRPWFLLGLKDKIPGLIRDNNRSWFWVKS